jgi:hypothetical protein
MFKFRFQTVTYEARNVKAAQAAFEKDAPNWLAQGYVLHSAVWEQGNRGCLSILFGTILVPNKGRLLVTYEGRNDVA